MATARQVNASPRKQLFNRQMAYLDELASLSEYSSSNSRLLNEWFTFSRLLDLEVIQGSPELIAKFNDLVPQFGSALFMFEKYLARTLDQATEDLEMLKKLYATVQLNIRYLEAINEHSQWTREFSPEFMKKLTYIRLRIS